MQAAVRDRLLEINRAFYQSLARPFASSRARPQPGVRRVMGGIDHGASVLDLGCGHGLTAGELDRLGHYGTYRGIDSSEALLDLARRRVSAPWADFIRADLADPAWGQTAQAGAFDWALAFAVLHHIPDSALRRRVVGEMRGKLRPNGRAAVSAWDFAGNDRFLRRRIGWETVGLTERDVEPGDHLLDWREGGRGVRYVHHFRAEELADLARTAGFAVEEEFHSDGEGGRLGLYQIWTPDSPSTERHGSA